MGQCSSDVVGSRWESCNVASSSKRLQPCSSRSDDEELDLEPRALSLERIKSLSSNSLVPAAHLREVQEGRKLSDDFAFPGEVLGHGLSGDVVVAHSALDGGRYAMKTISKGHGSSKIQQLTSEVEIYITLSHPNIAKLYGIYEGGGRVCLLMECCSGGELYAKLQERGVYSPPEAAEASRQMLRAMSYIHSRNVVHRDVKLENYLYESKDEDAQLKLIDFGFARVWDESCRPMLSPCGSISYVSPDVLHAKGYTNKCDLWSLGVVIWMLLCGYPPFHGQDNEVMRKIKEEEPDWSHKSRWKNVPEEAVNLVKKLLDKDALRRPGAAEAAGHPWLAEEARPPLTECSPQRPPQAAQRSRPSLGGS